MTKKKPTNLRLLQGNPGKIKIPKNEPAPDVEIPEPPEHLTGYALDEWNRITPILFRLGLISNVDAIALAMYCTAVKTWRKAEEELETQGLTINTSNLNVIQNPLLGIRNTAIEVSRKLLTEFGMTPSSRAGVTPNKKQEPDNPMAKFKRK